MESVSNPQRYRSEGAAVYRFLAGPPSERSEVETPTRAEIWIDISPPFAPILRLWDHKSVGTSASLKPLTLLEWEREGRGKECRYFGLKKSTKEMQWHRNRKEDRKRYQNMEKGWRKAMNTNGLCVQGLKIETELVSANFSNIIFTTLLLLQQFYIAPLHGYRGNCWPNLYNFLMKQFIDHNIP